MRAPDERPAYAMAVTLECSTLWLVRWAGVALFVPSLAAAQTALLTTEHVRAELLAHAPAGVAPGKPLWLALALQHQPHWHSYWRNP
ncbi:MAG TPA: hypothetical protein VLJ62_14900, partial [Burkholderiaceae bacterium]|nr:hypothetical protein [Burkholderiaceae bacterium]